MKLLICGLPGSGKTTFARELAYHFLIPHHNADTVREMTDNWDFSPEGRMTQATFMGKQWGILDLVAPTDYLRLAINPTKIIFMDTIKEGRFEDTNALFERPARIDCRHIITEWIPIPELRERMKPYDKGVKGLQEFIENGLD